MMTRFPFSFRQFQSPVALVALAGACVCSIGGCERQDTTSKAVRQASHDVHVIGGGGGPAATVLFENKQYTEVIAALTPVLENGLEEEKAAALVIMAQAQMGLAAEPAGIAASLERECLDRMTIIRSLLGDWLTYNARAAALDQFDPGPTLTELGTGAAQKDKLIAEQQAAKAKFDAQIAELRAQAAQRTTVAQSEENAYANLKGQASKLSAVQAEPLIRQAAAHKRTSDESRNAGALLDAKADQVARQSAEAQLIIDQYTNQKANGETTGRALRDKLAASKAESTAARAEAAKAAARIDSLINELRTLRTGPITESTEKAVRGYQTAAASARKASAGDQNGGSKLTLGAAQQATGDSEWSRAQGLGAYAQLLDSLAKAEPALGKRVEYAKEAASVSDERIKALEAAQAAFGAAKDAYAGVRSRGEAKDRLEQLSASAARLEEALGKMAKGETVDLSAAARPAAAPDADGADAPKDPAASPTAAATSSAPPELVSAVEKLIQLTAAKNFGAMADLMYFPPGAESFKAPIGSLMTGAARLDAACRAKFNAGLDQALKSLPGAGAFGGMSGSGLSSLSADQLAAMKASDLTMVVNADRATVTFPGVAEPLGFIKSGNAWLMDGGLAAMPVDALKQQAAMFGPLGTAFEELAADVDAGKFQTVQAVGVGFMQKLQGIMAKMQQGGPGGG